MKKGWSFKPPSVESIYWVAFILAPLISTLFQFQQGAFEKDPHPHPTKGSPVIFILAFGASVSFAGVAGLLVIARWSLWPKERSLAWNLHAAAYLAVAACIFLPPIVGPALVKLWPTPEQGWIDDNGCLLPDGVAAAHFPASYERLEKDDWQRQSWRFQEYAVEGSVVYFRRGFLGFDGRVSFRELASEKEALAAVRRLIIESERDGYLRTYGDQLVAHDDKEIPESSQLLEAPLVGAEQTCD